MEIQTLSLLKLQESQSSKQVERVSKDGDQEQGREEERMQRLQMSESLQSVLS